MRVKRILANVAFTIASCAVGMWIGAAHQRDAGFTAFNNELSSVVDQVVKQVDQNPTSAGVLKAREILNEKKSDLRNKLADLKSEHAARAGGATLTEFAENLSRNRLKLQQLITENPGVKEAVKNDRQFRISIAKLIADYHSLIQ